MSEMNIFIIYLMFVHWLGDFVFQTEEMATKKKEIGYYLFSHVITYGVVLLIGLLCYNGIYGELEVLPKDNRGGILVFCFANTCFHFIVDMFTSQTNDYYYSQGKYHQFFVSIGFDQFLHFAILYFTYYDILIGG